MSEQIRIYNKNKCDLSIDNVTITAANDEATNTGQDFVDLLRNRSNSSGWATTGSSDTATCTLEFELASGQEVDTLILIEHNFKDYDLHYWTGIAWTLIEAVTSNTETTNYHHFNSVIAYKIRVTINSTQVANEDKRMAQFIITDKLQSGQFEGFPVIQAVKHKTNKRVSTMLSGKALVVEGIGSTEFTLSYKLINLDNDLALLESMYNLKQGFLISLSGGDEAQFSSSRIGYRKKDLYFVRMMDDYADNFYKGIYSSGVVIKAKLREAVL